MSITKLLNNICLNTYNKYSQDPANALVTLGALGWILSSAAQLTMLITNKNIDAKQKKFLIPQEAADGIVNVGLFYTITAGIKKCADLLVEKGHIMLRSTYDTIGNFKQIPMTVQSFAKGVSDVFFSNGKIPSPKLRETISGFYEGITEILQDSIKNGTNILQSEKLNELFKNHTTLESKQLLLEKMETAQQEFKSFKSGVGVVAAVGASILASSIITPIVRNKVASAFQQKTLAKEKNKQNTLQLQYNSMHNVPISNTFNKFKI